MQANAIDPAKTAGWGIDVDRTNDPTYPMRDRSQDDSPGMNWRRPPLQTPTVEILQSIEHNRRPAVVGTSTPPSGLSGVIRRISFRYSESQWAHWLLLMLADRINTVEGLIQDLGRGKVPNVFAEMGMASDVKHDRGAVVAKAATVAVVLVGLAALTYHLTRPPRRKSLYRRLRG